MLRTSFLSVLLLVNSLCFGEELIGGNVLPQVRFKDGTILKNATIFFGENGDWRPRPDGLWLEVGGRIYFHHYPSREFKKTFGVPTLDDGKYITKTVKRTYRVLTPRPPKEEHWNPNRIPECVPSRIRFIHFDANTLNIMYKIIDATVKHYEKDPDREHLSLHYRTVRDSIKENAWRKLKAHELNTAAQSKAWQNKVEREMRLHWQKIHYGKWLRQRN